MPAGILKKCLPEKMLLAMIKINEGLAATDR